MKIILYIASSLSVFILFGDCAVFQTFNDDDLSSCYIHLVCVLNDTADVYQFVDNSSAQVKTKIWEYVYQVLGYKGQHSREHFEKMKDVFCNNTDEKKQLDFYEIFSFGYEYVFEVCRNPFSALCKELDELMMKISVWIKKVKESGKCDGAKPLTKPKSKPKDLFG
ncbi:uncharacterized protein LOC129977713 [Argiope bruennichi]|uniref:uncharacterized protein LOC129977713 n=1 Tax=Argiope bruennichi TaxID=94029 RepID=UPI0024945B00|nr:uncharacterized protein LOC129977713 [Argiope bruennichi]